MNKKELVSAIVDILKNNDIRKRVQAKKTTLHISDDSGNKKNFTVKTSSKSLLFNMEDVEYIVDAALDAITDSIKRGEPIDIRGFGVLDIYVRRGRDTIHPDTNEEIHIPDHYVPRFKYGNRLKTAARVYEESLGDAFEPMAGLVEDTEG